MKLFIMRHGEAESPLSWTPQADSARNLTDFGRLQAQRNLAACADKLGQPELIITSPYQRAQQTAEFARSEFPEAKFQTLSMITPEGNPGQVIEQLYQFSQSAGSILMVSHQPLVSELIAQLVGEGFYPMHTASIAGLETEVVAQGLANLEFLVHSQ